ncbi:MAG: protein-L-isoaspartate(D-aspartate) O-methyltransferase [Candidatus Diapherotrites archaeon]
MDEGMFTAKRVQLIEFMKSKQAVKSREVEAAFLKVKRELFFNQKMLEHAYQDDAFPIVKGQTISQPSTIAIMLEMLDVKKGMKILEVGSGSGYVVALLSELVGEDGFVYGIEMEKELIESSGENLTAQGSLNNELIQGDGSKGLPDKAPFDRILISAGAPFIPKPLFDQLKEKGIIVAPVGDQWTQVMEKMTKFRGKPVKNYLSHSYFAFVPLKGDFGWK